MAWVFLFTSVVGSAAERVGHRYLLRSRSHVEDYQVGFGLGALLLLIPWVKSPLNFGFPLCGGLVVSGLLWYFGNHTSFRADRVATASASALASQVQLLFTLVGEMLFFGEFIALRQVPGILLILIGFGVAARQSAGEWRGIAIKILSAGLKASALLCDKGLARWVSPPTIAAFAYALPLVLSVGGRAAKAPRAITVPNLILGALSAGVYVCMIKATSLLPISIVFSVYQTNLILTILLAYLALGERHGFARRFSAGSIITLGAIFIGMGIK